MTAELTAAEAAARLGVKRSTLYAYVSRGLLHRHLAMDGKTSLFDSDEVDTFRMRRRRTAEGELDTVIGTSITSVADGRLLVRGRDLIAYADRPYEEVVDWLWESPGATWTLDDATRAQVRRVQSAMPPASVPLDRLRVTTAVVSATDPLRFDSSPSGVCAAGRALQLAMVEGLSPAGSAHHPIADRLWSALAPDPSTPARRSALNAAMVLLIDHGLASSTFAARVAASVRADPYSVVLTGLGVVGGRLHGAASGDVHRLLDEAARLGPAVAVGEVQRRTEATPGFGHAVYRSADPRYVELIGRVRRAWSDDERVAVLETLLEVVLARSATVPNVDLALGALTWLAGMPADAGEAVFALARTAGWIAHGLEEMTETPLRFRPRARYVGGGSG